MSSRLGRNPFDKAKKTSGPQRSDMSATVQAEEQIIGELIDLPDDEAMTFRVPAFASLLIQLPELLARSIRR